MIMVLRMLTVASTILAFSPSALRAMPSPELQSVFGFCKAHMTVDYPPGKGFGSPDDGDIPPELPAIEAEVALSGSPITRLLRQRRVRPVRPEVRQ